MRSRSRLRFRFGAQAYPLFHLSLIDKSVFLHNLKWTERIRLNSGIGLMGYGWRANNTIGHAVRLCLINLGHVWPAENDMALIGRPSSHTCYVFAENERQSPWAPYHVTRGLCPKVRLCYCGHNRDPFVDRWFDLAGRWRSGALVGGIDPE